MIVLRFYTAALFGLLASVPLGATEEADPEQSEIYIPIDLEDTFTALDDLLEADVIQDMKSGSETDMLQYHFGLGVWMRNNWGLWGGSRLSAWFNKRGIYHPDDMSGIILDSYRRHLNDQPIQLEQQITRYQEFWGDIEDDT